MDELNGAETLFAFLVWLTMRDTPVTFSKHHEAGIAVQLFDAFIAANPQCETVREDWYERWTIPVLEARA